MIVLIIDDEPLVAANIEAGLYDLRDTFTVVGTARSAREALDIIEKDPPDVVISDIIMPGMTGIELLKICAQRFEHIRFVLVSGYAEFSYAQAAIQYGACAYCLKPVQDEELQSAVLQAVKMRPRPADRNAEFWEMINDSKNARLELACYFAGSSYSGREPRSFLVLYLVGSGTSPLSQFPHFQIYAGRRKRLVLLDKAYEESFTEAMRRWSESNPESLSIGCAAVARNFGELSERYQLSMYTAYSYFFAGRHGYFDGMQQPTNSETVLRSIEQAILKQDISEINVGFKELKQQFLSGDADIRLALLCYNTLTYFLTPEHTDQWEYIFDPDVLVHMFSDVQEMCDYLSHQVRASLLLEDGILLESEKIKNKTLQSVVSYINANFQTDLSVQSIAKLFYVNISYLCQIFKKETGYTITEYINKLRIEQARSLIHNADLPLGEICERVGFTDYCYFNKVFRRIVGKSPLQYSKELPEKRNPV